MRQLRMSQGGLLRIVCDSCVAHDPIGRRLVALVAGLIETYFATLIYSGSRKRLFGGVLEQNRIFGVYAEILFDAQ
ncbi:hypothetical protein EMGBS4_10960 [Acidimicrobiaceae bacterium]|nr:hypothetical protein EMGBS4_10960 [Acidimicrobiaceae bacterium]